jgi:hypothetical protein
MWTNSALPGIDATLARARVFQTTAFRRKLIATLSVLGLQLPALIFVYVESLAVADIVVIYDPAADRFIGLWSQ